MSYDVQSLREFTAALASGEPTPGGGAACALLGAQAAALASMVAALTLKNKRHEETWPEMEGIVAEMAALRADLLACMDEDAAAFAALMRAWRLPKEDISRPASLLAATYTAALAPLRTAELAAGVLAPARAVLAHGVKSAASDGELAVLFALAAIRGSLINVRINLKSLPENEMTGELVERVAVLEKIIGQEEAIG